MLTIPIVGASAVQVSEDGEKVAVVLRGPDGGPIALDIATANLAAIISVMIEARAKAVTIKAPSSEALHLKEFKAWEVGTTLLADCAIMVFDRGTADQVALRVHPQTARVIGKELVAQSRRCAEAKSKRVSN